MSMTESIPQMNLIAVADMLTIESHLGGCVPHSRASKLCAIAIFAYHFLLHIYHVHQYLLVINKIVKHLFSISYACWEKWIKSTKRDYTTKL